MVCFPQEKTLGGSMIRSMRSFKSSIGDPSLLFPPLVNERFIYSNGLEVGLT